MKNKNMTTLAILADTHGNLPALQAVLAELQVYRVDGIIVAGDLTAGPHPNQTMRMLSERNAWMIRGNTDENVLLYASRKAPVSWSSSLQWAIMRWTHAHLDSDMVALLQTLPDQCVIALEGLPAIRVVHGSPRSSHEGLHPDRFPESLAAAMELTREPVLVCAHTHIPWNLRRDGHLVLNPGSVACPLNGDTRAHYALLHWQHSRWHVEPRAVAYDLGLIRRDFIESGLLGEGGTLARAFLLSIETGHDVSRDFFAQIQLLAAQQGLEDLDVVPDAIWEQAATNFDWGRWERT